MTRRTNAWLRAAATSLVISTAFSVQLSAGQQKTQPVEGETSLSTPASIAGKTVGDRTLINRLRHVHRLWRAVRLGLLKQSRRTSVRRPVPPPPVGAPANLEATVEKGRLLLTWDPVNGATSYRVFRTTTEVFEGRPIARVRRPRFRQRLREGATYMYRVSAHNRGGDGPFSAVVTVTLVEPPPAPEGVSATPGDQQVSLSWTLVPEVTSYNVYRGTAPGQEDKRPLATGLPGPPFVDTPVENGTTLYYLITGVNEGGEGRRSAEVSAIPSGPPPVVDPTYLSTFQLLRQATWGPRPGEVERVMSMGVDGFMAEQFGAPASTYPDLLFEESVEAMQEHFMQLAMTGPDQLRQRMAWALHKIWVVSANEVNHAPAMVTYYRLLMNGAFGNYRDLMAAVTLNPAMGQYLNMLNNKSQQVTGVPANENYPRELMQLFMIGLARLNPDGTPMVDGMGQPEPAYSEEDVKELARILTGWTFGGGSTGEDREAHEDFTVPMEAVEANHDAGMKIFLGEIFPAGQAATADLNQALDVLFNHPNVGPFIGRQLIQQLVTSNPSPTFVADVAAVFDNNGSGQRGDLAAVVRAILTHPEAGMTNASSGKLAEPVLFVVSQLRALDAVVTDHPFMSGKVAEMGQRVFYPPSVFSYFSPGFRVVGTGTPPLAGPEFQGLTSVTALVRANFVARVLGSRFGEAVTIDYAPLTSLAPDASALVDYVNVLVMGGRMSLEEHAEIVSAVVVSPPEQPLERVRTALYLALTLGQSQVDRCRTRTRSRLCIEAEIVESS